MTDDVGFAASSTFGGPIPTPNLDRLAAHGLKYNEFHTTAICSATRAALLTGRNHHAVGTAALADVASPYPGYTTRVPKSAATIARILRDNGYNTAMFGKHHNVPTEDRTAAGPFDQWPTGWGFEYFYGFISGDTNQWQPALYQGITPVDGSHRDSRYILERDLTDHAIDWLHDQQAAAPDKPFFHLLRAWHCTCAASSAGRLDREVPRKVRRRLGQAARGDLGAAESDGHRPRRSGPGVTAQVIPAWDSLSLDEKRINARYMEVYAGMLAFQDAQFGRLLDEIERMGIANNTLVVFIEGDNGASGEAGPTGALNELVHLQASAPAETPQWLAQNLDIMGGPKSYESYPVGWALAMDTPFPWVKQIASHLGGVRNGLVISWPNAHQSTGRAEEPVSPRHRHPADFARCRPHQSADDTSMVLPNSASTAPA